MHDLNFLHAMQIRETELLHRFEQSLTFLRFTLEKKNQNSFDTFSEIDVVEK